jgi:hypothetical protein
MKHGEGAIGKIREHPQNIPTFCGEGCGEYVLPAFLQQSASRGSMILPLPCSRCLRPPFYNSAVESFLVSQHWGRVHVRCACRRDRLLMPITLLSDGKVKGKTTIHSLKHRLRCRSCGKRPKTVFVDKWQD